MQERNTQEQRNPLKAAYIRLTVEMMKEAYISGQKGKDISSIIGELKAKETPLMKATAAALEAAYTAGSRARG